VRERGRGKGGGGERNDGINRLGANDQTRVEMIVVESEATRRDGDGDYVCVCDCDCDVLTVLERKRRAANFLGR
jgi:hypothetical protein